MPVADPNARRRTPVAGEQQLLEEFRPLAYAISRGYYLPGADENDVRQEALLGVLFAIRTWRAEAGASLRSLVVIAVHRQLKTAVTAARRMKHEVMNDSIRGTVSVDDGDHLEVIDIVTGDRPGTHELVVDRERLSALLLALPALSPLERRWIAAVANGEPYADDKRADNAIQRGRAKLRAALDLQEAA